MSSLLGTSTRCKMQHWDPNQTALASKLSPLPPAASQKQASDMNFDKFGLLCVFLLLLLLLFIFIFYFLLLFFFYLVLVDVQNPFQWHLLKVQSVTLIKICAHRLWVAIHHDRFVAKLTQCADTGDSTPIKLHTAACQETEKQARKGWMQGRKQTHVLGIWVEKKKKKRASIASCQLRAWNLIVTPWKLIIHEQGPPRTTGELAWLLRKQRPPIWLSSSCNKLCLSLLLIQLLLPLSQPTLGRTQEEQA